MVRGAIHKVGSVLLTNNTFAKCICKTLQKQHGGSSHTIFAVGVGTGSSGWTQ